ncbi:MAG: helix-turn-helix transcriptional regulator [Eubacteriales bacterium]|nr:helix-turn-helix transcriptional regulator [Eubacteriales bacterium]
MDKKLFGKQLQQYRERAGYSQEALAERIECSTIFISYIERGEKSPSLDTLLKLANALDISIDLLFGRERKQHISEKMKDIEKQLTALPVSEQQKILDILDSVVSIELNYHYEKDFDKF